MTEFAQGSLFIFAEKYWIGLFLERFLCCMHVIT